MNTDNLQWGTVPSVNDFQEGTVPFEKAMVAMSGGVDSSVAAYLVMNRGYDTIGVTMKLFDRPDRESTCCSLEDVEDARSVANKLGINYYVFNFEDDFDKEVIRRFVEAYEEGRTPNPCIDCNRYIKFKRLFQRAMELKQDYVVTGHYAQVRFDSGSGRHLLTRSLDPAKDQSYVLYSMDQNQLAHAMFPLGSMNKEETREIAESQGFINAKKRDSQDICFVPDGKYSEFIREYTGKSYPEGDFVDTEGKILGRHKGLINYTIGQRRGLGLALPESLYVIEKDIKENRVILARNEELYKKTLEVKDLNWIAIPSLESDLNCYVKIRYSQKGEKARLIPLEDGKVHVEFEEPQRAPTPGQAAVFYDGNGGGDVVIGGGTII